MSTTSLATLPQFTLQLEPYLRFDGKKHVLTGREHRRNPSDRYMRVAFRTVFTCSVPSSEQLEDLKRAIDELHLQGIITKVEGATVLIMTDIWCNTSNQRVKKLKIHLYKQVLRAIDPRQKSPVRIKSADSLAIQRRRARQNNPRQLVLPDVAIAPEASVPTTVEPASPDISALVTTVSHRILTSCVNHHDLDNLESELTSGLLIAAG